MSATAEKYGRAIRSSHLKSNSVEPCDLDVLVAAGAASRDKDGHSGESLGVALMRLRSEYDGTPRQPGNNKLTEHLLILIHLKSLSGVSELLARYALQQADRRCLIASVVEIRATVAKVLEFFLDPSCHPCRGKGFTGGYGVPQLHCVHCAKSRELGHRRIDWGDVGHLEDFGLYLLDEMSAKMRRAEDRIGRHLRSPAA